MPPPLEPEAGHNILNLNIYLFLLIDNVTICSFYDNFSNSFLYLNLIFFLFRGVLFKIHISLFKTNLEFLNLEAVLLKLLVLLILRPYHLNGMLFLTRFLMIENSCMFP